MTGPVGRISRMDWTNPGWSLVNSPLHLVAFNTAIADRSVAVTEYRRWPTDATSLDGLDAELRHFTSHGESAFILTDDVAALVELEHGAIEVQIGADNRDASSLYLVELERMFPRSEGGDGTVPVSFWSYGPHGPIQTTRRIDVHPWDEIAGNYPGETRLRLDGMVTAFRPSHGGQLILWQGQPGTGKTHALRALAWEWRSWADIHYIVDPDEMFGHHADYLISVLLCGNEEQPRTVGEEDTGRAGRWNVLVLEDTGEMLAADAKERTGQALSRLLNVVDGLIGQGLRVLVLVTTNEELKSLHPAIARPGRCAAQVTFEGFSPAEARDWLAERDVDAQPAAMSLAELYALAEDYAGKPSRRPVGFAMR